MALLDVFAFVLSTAITSAQIFKNSEQKVEKSKFNLRHKMGGKHFSSEIKKNLSLNNSPGQDKCKNTKLGLNPLVFSELFPLVF